MAQNTYIIKYNHQKMAVLELILAFINFLSQIIISIFNYISSLVHERHQIPPIENPILLQSAVTLAKSIRDRKLTSREIVEAFIERCRQVNTVLNAIVENRYEEALEEADQIDHDIASGAIADADFEAKPFLGVPFTSKESCHHKGMNISYSIVERIGIKAEEDADIVKNVRRSGAILIGTTNVPQINQWYETWNPVYGRTNNPYDTRRNVGGSSGGEASILAACGSPLSLASDIGGSIRIPSFMCGLFGHKPSSGLTSTKGMTYRTGIEKDSTILVAGSIVKYADDIIPFVKVIIGPESNVLKLDEPVDVTKLNIFYMLELGSVLVTPIDSDMKDSVLRVVDYFTGKGNAIEQIVKVDEFKYATKLYKYWTGIEKNTDFPYDVTGRTKRANFFEEVLKKLLGRSNLTWYSIFILAQLYLPNLPEELAIEYTNSCKKKLLDKLSNNGVLLFPSYVSAAPYHYRTLLCPFNFVYFAIFNVLKLPVTQVPLGLNREGLPLGIQVVAAPMQDRLCIAVAKELEKAFGGYVKPC